MIDPEITEYTKNIQDTLEFLRFFLGIASVYLSLRIIVAWFKLWEHMTK